MTARVAASFVVKKPGGRGARSHFPPPARSQPQSPAPPLYRMTHVVSNPSGRALRGSPSCALSSLFVLVEALGRRHGFDRNADKRAALKRRPCAQPVRLRPRRESRAATSGGSLILVGYARDGAAPDSRRVAELLAVPVTWTRESTRSGAIPYLELGRRRMTRNRKRTTIGSAPEAKLPAAPPESAAGLTLLSAARGSS